jgi:hypothetical protein
MGLPEFPDARGLELEDKPLLDRLLAEMQPELSQYTFANIYAWRLVEKTRIARSGESVVLYLELPDGRVFLEPLGPGDKRTAVERCLSASRDRPAEFRYLVWNFVAMFQGDPRYVIEQDRSNSDYLYMSRDLIGLAGRRFDAKRNFIKRFSNKHPWRYRTLTPELVPACLEFEQQWCIDRSCHKDVNMCNEHRAVVEMLNHLQVLGLTGGVIETDAGLAGYTLGERLNRDTFVVHAEKGDARFPGIYAVINNEFCRQEAAGCQFVNREQDMGIPGLRKAKLSYHPVRMIDAYRLMLQA